MADDLEARLQSHAQAFEGLLSLIPAKYYYEQDNSDQWERKKQTPEERKAAKKAKLNPASHKSAKDVMDDNERKRRREDEEAEVPYDMDTPGQEKPLEGLKPPKQKIQKQKADKDVHSQVAGTDRPLPQQSSQSKEQKDKDKVQKRKEKRARQDEKRKVKEAKKATRQARLTTGTISSGQKQPEQTRSEQRDSVTPAPEEEDTAVFSNDMGIVDVTGLVQDAEARTSASASPAPGSAISHVLPQPSSSTSSFAAPARNGSTRQHVSDSISDAPFSSEKSDTTTPSKSARPPSEQTKIWRAALDAKILQFRKMRNADGLDGKPARNRAEFIEARRIKEEKRERRKQLKKNQLQQSKEDEKKAEMEAELALMRGSPSVASDLLSGGLSPPNSFSFGRVAFKDGTRVNSSLSGLMAGGSTKGAQDTRTALLAAEKKKARLASLDDEKRADIEEKDVWLNAKKKVNGERVRDDTNLLKKTLKRKESIKLKSEKEWNERIEGVKKGQDFKQKKREANLAKRREEKGEKGKKKHGAKKGVVKKTKNRPGFEGSFRGRA